MTEVKAPYTVLTEAAASVRLDGQTQYDPLEVLIAGCDNEELHGRALAEYDRLVKERDAWKAKYSQLFMNVKRHADGILAALIKSEGGVITDK